MIPLMECPEQTDPQTQILVVRGWGWGVASGGGISFWSDENILE